MNPRSTGFGFRSAALAAALLLLAFAAGGCERSEESFRAVRNAQATNPYQPGTQRAELIKRLEGAKELDMSEARRAGISGVAWEDDMGQAAKADRAIKELSHGLEVSQSELYDALWVPPSLSNSEKATLIHQVRQAIQKDQHEEDSLTLSSNMANFPYPTNAVVRLEDHKELAQGVLKDLEAGEDVHWQTIKEALQSPRPED